MKIVVLGAGLMGRAVVYDLSGAREVKNIVVADFDRGRAQEVARKFGRGITRGAFADVRDTRHLAKLLARLRCGGELHAIQLESGRDARGARRSRELHGPGRPLSHDDASSSPWTAISGASASWPFPAWAALRESPM